MNRLNPQEQPADLLQLLLSCSAVASLTPTLFSRIKRVVPARTVSIDDSEGRCGVRPGVDQKPHERSWGTEILRFR